MKQPSSLSSGRLKVTMWRWSRVLGEAGDAMVIGIAALVVLVLVVLGFAMYFTTHKPQVGVTYVPPSVTADDDLAPGKSNNELAQDMQIVAKGLERDDTQRQAADKALSDQAQTIGDDSDTAITVEASRLSTLQTQFISEGDRRLQALSDASKLTAKLPADQQDITSKLITDENTAITGLKAKAAAESTFDAFSADEKALDKEYGNYLLALGQVYLLTWANGQSALEDKVNIVGGKYQERINDADSQGKDTAQAQIFLNTFQAGKTTATGLTATVLKAVPPIKPGDYNANRSVLRTYYAQLSTAHDNLKKSQDASTGLAGEMSKFSAQ